jgi:hypothetical protein
MDRRVSEPVTIKLKLSCVDTDACTVNLEPYGAHHELSGEDHFDVTISGEGSGEVEVAYVPEGITSWIWGGATYRITNSRGVELFL